MTVILTKGRLRVRQSRAADDIAKALALRSLCFRGQESGADMDGLDATCAHVLIEDVSSGQVLGCFRMLPLSGAELSLSYSAQFYDLSALEGFCGPMVEMGRFCVHPDHSGDPDVLRAAWGAMTRYVDAHGVELLFGCSSFQGTETERYLDSFAMLKERHLAPARWLPRVKAPKVFRFAAKLRRRPDLTKAMRAMPPLLRTYLLMGGWVSDHAVVDDEMDTLHVFTGVEIGRIPAARKRLLRAVSG